MCLRHLLIIGALGSMLAACDMPFGPTKRTYVLGNVGDTVGRPVPGARIEILDGPRAGASTIADDRGAFEITGTASGAVRLRANRDGFESSTVDTVWSTTNVGGYAQGTVITLKTLDPGLPIAPGAYTLTVASDLATATGIQGASCAGFPADLLRRTYEASVSYVTAFDHFLVRLGGPTLIKYPNGFESSFALRVAGQFVGFELEIGFGAPAEELPGFRYLMIGGNAPTGEPASSTNTSFTIPFHGWFEYCQLKSALGSSSCQHAPSEQVIEHHVCTSRNDTMVFTKR